MAAGHRFEVHDLGQGLITELDAGELEQLVDDAREPLGLGGELGRQTGDHLGLVLVGQGLGQERDGSDRVFSSWLMLATRSVRTESSRVRSLTSSIVPTAPTISPSITMAEPARRGCTGEGRGHRGCPRCPDRRARREVGLDGLVDERVEMRHPEHPLGAAVAHDDPSRAVDDDHALLQAVDGGPELRLPCSSSATSGCAGLATGALTDGRRRPTPLPRHSADRAESRPEPGGQETQPTRPA